MRKAKWGHLPHKRRDSENRFQTERDADALARIAVAIKTNGQAKHVARPAKRLNDHPIPLRLPSITVGIAKLVAIAR